MAEYVQCKINASMVHTVFNLSLKTSKNNDFFFSTKIQELPLMVDATGMKVQRFQDKHEW